ncbi:MAG: hypothetical protein MJZ81_07485 [Bacteroidales bacterium]|nr:hypothetical protein [Bacteroidales bacterium]
MLINDSEWEDKLKVKDAEIEKLRAENKKLIVVLEAALKSEGIQDCLKRGCENCGFGVGSCDCRPFVDVIKKMAEKEVKNDAK